MLNLQNRYHHFVLLAASRYHTRFANLIPLMRDSGEALHSECVAGSAGADGAPAYVTVNHQLPDHLLLKRSMTRSYSFGGLNELSVTCTSTPPFYASHPPGKKKFLLNFE